MVGEEEERGEDRPRHQEDHLMELPAWAGLFIIQKCFSLMSSENLSVLELRLQDEPHLWHQVKGKLEMTPTSSFPGQLLSHGTHSSRQIKINLKTNKKHKRVLCISMIPALIRLNEAGRLL